MIIIGFDCATLSFGVAILRYNEHWQIELKSIIQEYKTIDLEKSSKGKIKKISNQINKMQQIIDNIFVPTYLNVFDLVPEITEQNDKNKKEKACNAKSNAKGKCNAKRKAKSKTITAPPKLKLSRLKAILMHLDCNPDLVLIELQMGPNHKTNDISSALISYYTTPDAAFKSFSTDDIFKNAPKSPHSYPKVELVGSSLKNTIAFSEEGKHINFVKKYMSLYTANKKHTSFNLLLFLKEFKFEHLIKTLDKAYIDDTADAFMMIIAYLYKNYIRPN